MNSVEKRIAVLVSGGGTNLQALIDAQHSGKITNGKITLVLSSKPGVFALERAKKNGIPACVLEPAAYADRAAYSSAVAAKFDEYGIDLVVFAGFNFILTSEFIKKYENRLINVHPALIPSFCGKGFYGLHTHKAVLASGVKLTGATVHFVTEVTDGGPIIAQKAVEVKEGDTPEILQRRVMEEAEWVILPHAVNLFCNDRITVEGNITHIR